MEWLYQLGLSGLLRIKTRAQQSAIGLRSIEFLVQDAEDSSRGFKHRHRRAAECRQVDAV